jgi:hypothetical protein
MFSPVHVCRALFGILLLGQVGWHEPRPWPCACRLAYAASFVFVMSRTYSLSVAFCTGPGFRIICCHHWSSNAFYCVWIPPTSWFALPCGIRKWIIKKSGARAQHSIFEHPGDMRPPPFEAIFESTLGTCDPHPSKSTLLTGLKQVKLRPMLIRIGADCVFVRGDSEYGTPVAIW